MLDRSVIVLGQWPLAGYIAGGSQRQIKLYMSIISAVRVVRWINLEGRALERGMMYWRVDWS